MHTDDAVPVSRRIPESQTPSATGDSKVRDKLDTILSPVLSGTSQWIPRSGEHALRERIQNALKKLAHSGPYLRQKLSGGTEGRIPSVREPVRHLSDSPGHRVKLEQSSSIMYVDDRARELVQRLDQYGDVLRARGSRRP